MTGHYKWMEQTTVGVNEFRFIPICQMDISTHIVWVSWQPPWERLPIEPPLHGNNSCVGSSHRQLWQCFWGLAHRSLCGSTVAGRYAPSESLYYIFDHHTGEEARVQEIQSEEVLEAEDGTKYHPDQEMMRREWPWSGCCHRVGTCPHLKVKLSAESLIRLTTDESIKDVAHIKTSLEGKKIYRDNCNKLTQKETKAYMRL